MKSLKELRKSVIETTHQKLFKQLWPMVEDLGVDDEGYRLAIEAAVTTGFDAALKAQAELSASAVTLSLSPESVDEIIDATLKEDPWKFEASADVEFDTSKFISDHMERCGQEPTYAEVVSAALSAMKSELDMLRTEESQHLSDRLRLAELSGKLRAENDGYKKHLELFEESIRLPFKQREDKLRDDKTNLQSQCAKLVESLEFYGELKNWKTITIDNKNQRFSILTGADLEYFQEPNQDSYCGKRARAALDDYKRGME